MSENTTLIDLFNEVNGLSEDSPLTRAIVQEMIEATDGFNVLSRISDAADAIARDARAFANRLIQLPSRELQDMAVSFTNGPRAMTVIGEHDHDGFTEPVMATDVRDAIRKAIALDPDRIDATITDVVLGHAESVSPFATPDLARAILGLNDDAEVCETCGAILPDVLSFDEHMGKHEDAGDMRRDHDGEAIEEE